MATLVEFMWLRKFFPKKKWYGSNGILMHPRWDLPPPNGDPGPACFRVHGKSQAKSDLIAAIDHGLIKTSYDYAAIESTLVPTMALPLGSHIRCGCGDS